MADESYADLVFQVPTGWKTLVADTLSRIYQVDPDFQTNGVLKSEGRLLLHGVPSYDHGTPNAMLAGRLAKHAEEESRRICETCGLPGLHGYADDQLVTLCSLHRPKDFDLIDD